MSSSDKKKEKSNDNLSEAVSALQVLGYNKRDIEKGIRKLDFENRRED